MTASSNETEGSWDSRNGDAAENDGAHDVAHEVRQNGLPNDEGHERYVKREAARPLRRMISTTQDSSEDQIWVAICILLRSFYEN